MDFKTRALLFVGGVVIGGIGVYSICQGDPQRMTDELDKSKTIYNAKRGITTIIGLYSMPVIGTIMVLCSFATFGPAKARAGQEPGATPNP